MSIYPCSHTSTPAEPVQASLLVPATVSLEVLERRREARKGGGGGAKEVGRIPLRGNPGDTGIS
jgi:hypothetical protein